MSYNNYGAPPGAYGNYAPPGMSPPPNTGPPPGMHAGSPTNSHFQQPSPNMPPGMNFNAPVIRMGVPEQAQPRTPSGGQSHRDSGRGSNAEPLGRRDRTGLGARDEPQSHGRNLDRERQAVRESMMALQPPTREEVARTIFIGGLSEGTPSDEAIENLLRCAGKLRRWTRARDAEDKKCRFGFAEYEDVESLEAANEIFAVDGGIEVPMFNKVGAALKDDEGEVKKAKLLIVVDEQSKNYIKEWKGKRGEDDDARQFRIDGCREDLRQNITALANQGAFLANANGDIDGDGDTAMGDINGETNGEQNAGVVTIPLSLEDELSDIPAEMRATVAEEIKAFRDRSNRRDIERMKREEELEQAEKNRGRVNRLASPPPSGAPSGPAGATNGIPSGPRGAAGAVQGAPSGPKGYRGAQMPSDYVNGVSFVGANGVPMLNREDEDAEESDEELERQRQEKMKAEREKHYHDAERRLQNRERTRAAAQERERVREEAEKREREREKADIAKRLADWDDVEEERLGREEYYYDRSSWLRKRGAYREREERDDQRDRAAEEREKGEEKRRSAEARGLADDFLDRTGSELQQKTAADERPEIGGPAFGGFKMNLGSAAARTRTAAQEKQAPRRTIADVEGLLEDEEDAAASGLTRRPELKPLTDTSTVPHGSDLTDSERAEARRQLAAEIPTTTESLFAYPVKFNYLTPAIIAEQIRPFVEKKIVDSLGVQEDLLVEIVVEGLKGRKEAWGVVGELGDALGEEEAEGVVRKVWRLVVFWTECEGRGLA